MKKINSTDYKKLLTDMGFSIDIHSISIVLTALSELCAERVIVGTTEGTVWFDLAQKLLKLAESKTVVKIL